MSLNASFLNFNSRLLEKINSEYINQSDKLQSLYSFYPNLQGFQNIIQEIQKYNFNRKQLTHVLLQQSQLVSNTSQPTIQNIQALTHPNTFSITTGHQLSLYTGPLFFIYKIITVIRISMYLKKHFPEYNFVPVFWMASEDHDIEEINHFFIKDKKFQWQKNNDGTPSGKLDTNGLMEIYQQLKDLNVLSEKDIQIFFNAYINHTNYADATRYLINDLFGKYGLITLNADDKLLKSLFIRVFHKDIFENATEQILNKSISFLEQNNYHIQAKPRPINTFYFHENKRFLLQNKHHQFQLKGTEVLFTKEALEEKLKNNPENFSPNVLLRPVYQQTILPNIAYVGGPAEVAYWLTLKPAFEQYKVFQPLIIQRPLIFITPANIRQKIEKYHLSIQNIFNYDKHTVLKNILNEFRISITLDNTKHQIQYIFQELFYQTENIDKTLIPFVNAEQAKTIKFIETLEQKLNKAIQQKHENIRKHIDDIYTNYFPQNTMQDRIWNIFYAYKLLGYKTVEELIDEIISLPAKDLKELIMNIINIEQSNQS